MKPHAHSRSVVEFLAQEKQIYAFFLFIWSNNVIRSSAFRLGYIYTFQWYSMRSSYVWTKDTDFFFCILMIFIDFQFYIQFYYTLLSLTTLLHSLTLTTLTYTYTYTSSSSFLHCKQFFLTYTYSSGTITLYCTLYLPHFILWADILLLDLAIIVSSW